MKAERGWSWALDCPNRLVRIYLAPFQISCAYFFALFVTFCEFICVTMNYHNDLFNFAALSVDYFRG